MPMAVAITAMTASACAKQPAAVARPMPRPASVPGPARSPRRPAERIAEPIPVPAGAGTEDAVGSKSLDDLNRDSPLKPVFFELDSAELSPAAQGTLQENATVLK